MDDFLSVAKTSDLSDGEIMLVEVGDERVALSRIDGSFYAIGDVCPHAEGPLSEGQSMTKKLSARGTVAGSI